MSPPLFWKIRLTSCKLATCRQYYTSICPAFNLRNERASGIMLKVVMSVISIAALSPPNAICYRLASSMTDRYGSVSLYHAINSDARIQHAYGRIDKLVTGLAFEMPVSTPIKRVSRGSSSTRRSNHHRRLEISPCAASTVSIVLLYCRPACTGSTRIDPLQRLAPEPLTIQLLNKLSLYVIHIAPIHRYVHVVSQGPHDYPLTTVSSDTRH